MHCIIQYTEHNKEASSALKMEHVYLQTETHVIRCTECYPDLADRQINIYLKLKAANSEISKPYWMMYKLWSRNMETVGLVQSEQVWASKAKPLHYSLFLRRSKYCSWGEGRSLKKQVDLWARAHWFITIWTIPEYTSIKYVQGCGAFPSLEG